MNIFNVKHIKKVIKVGLLAAGLTCAFGASAGYDANKAGVVKSVITYAHTDKILVLLDKMPEHPTCKKTYFAIDAKLPADRRQQMLARLLTAFATGKATNIGYDAKGDCAHGYIRLYRVG